MQLLLFIVIRLVLNLVVNSLVDIVLLIRIHLVDFVIQLVLLVLQLV